MIAKLHRFHGFTSLRFVYSRGRTVRGSAVSLKYSLNSRRSEYRAAVVVSRKVHKSAVVRNRIRRRIYEVIRHLEPSIIQPYDMVLTVYSDTVADMPAASVQGMVADLLHKAGVTSKLPHTPEGRAIVVPKEQA